MSRRSAIVYTLRLKFQRKFIILTDAITQGDSNDFLTKCRDFDIFSIDLTASTPPLLPAPHSSLSLFCPTTQSKLTSSSIPSPLH